MLRKILRDEVTREWRRRYNEELYDVHLFLPNIIRVVRSRKMIWEGMWHVWGDERCIEGYGGET